MITFLVSWAALSVIVVFAICRAIHNDKAREAGQGKFEA